MRYLLASISLAALFATGCQERHSMRVVPDRQDHAYTDDKASKGGGSLTNDNVAGPGEQWITVQPGQTLTWIAKKYGTTTRDIIERNELADSLPKVGQNLIVPNPGAPAPATGPGGK
jgi:LysM repeat protein